MAAGKNGTKWSLDLRPPSEVTKFRIGGQDIDVPALSLYAMDVVKDELLVLGPDLDFVAYARNVIRIVLKLLKLEHPEIELDEVDLMKACSVGEMRGLATAMNDLLGLSGFDGGPTEATAGAAPGIGTSTESSPDLPPTGSAEATSSG